MKFLVIRLSAMGDVAMCAPVLKALTEQYPEHDYFFLTRKAFGPFFENIKNLTLIYPDLNGIHKGFLGLFKLFRKLKSEIKPNQIIDLHDVLRTKYLRFLFRLSGVKTFSIDKGRKEKNKLVVKSEKQLTLLKHTVERYADTFKKAALNIRLLPNEYELFEKKSDPKKESFKIGIAPFAKHIQKQYPLEMMKSLIKLLDSNNYMVYIFGGGVAEKKFAEESENSYKNVFSMIGKMSLKEEIEMISTLDIMITMDSGNMHISALTGIKIVSIWGATHPFAGFSPYTKKENSIIIQDENLDCRPCSVFGNKTCFKKTLECMYNLSPEKIFQVCEQALNS